MIGSRIIKLNQEKFWTLCEFVPQWRQYLDEVWDGDEPVSFSIEDSERFPENENQLKTWSS